MENKKLVKQYLNKYFKQDYLEEDDNEFKALVRILNKKDKQVKNNVVLPDVSSSTLINPISCTLDENTKKYIEMVEFTNKQFEKYATDILRVPKEMFGSK